jgi:hypothetical protein
MLTYISNTAHYKEVLSRVQSVKHSLWIGIADIKDLYVDVGKEKKNAWGSHRSATVA